MYYSSVLLSTQKPVPSCSKCFEQCTLWTMYYGPYNNLWNFQIKRKETKQLSQRFAIACVLVTLPALSGRSGNFEQKAFLQAIEQLIQYTVAKIQFQCLKFTTVIRIRKNLSNFPFLSKQFQVITVWWCKQPTSNSFQTCLYCIYLFKLYDKSIIILLTNVLANICSEISQIRLILLMVYTCNVKGLEEVQKLGRNKCTLCHCARSPAMSDCSRPYQ